MVDSAGCESQIVYGMDSKVCASYKRSQHYCEEAVGAGLLWLDHVPGKFNPADIFSKQVRNVGEFTMKNGVVCGSASHLYESVALRGILHEAPKGSWVGFATWFSNVAR